MKLWGGRFNKTTHAIVETYTASISFDYVLAEFDILGSLAHVTMLEKCALLTTREAENIKQGLRILRDKIRNNKINFTVDDEDIHMNIERLLHKIIGDEADKLHTGRSRNDQVALDLHLYLRQQIITLITQLNIFNEALLIQAQNNIDTFIPGYTHLQRAEPIRFAQHFLAYFNMFQRDSERLQDSWKRVNVCPLGAGALAGVGLKIDRAYVAELLNFSAFYENSMDAVSDRDFIVEFLADASLIMMHLSKLSEEIILWSSKEFAFIELDDAFCTGSSMMPQKKNPDVAELTRGKTGRVYGALFNLLTVLKGLPLAYNKDLQEDKESLFDIVKTLQSTLTVYLPMISTMRVIKKNTWNAVHNDYANATQVANYLVKKEIAFRKAHEITGKIVRYCIEQEILLVNLDLKIYQEYCPVISGDIYSFIAIENVIEAHCSIGGTAKASVLTQLKFAQKKIEETKHWLDQHSQSLVCDL